LGRNDDERKNDDELDDDGDAAGAPYNDAYDDNIDSPEPRGAAEPRRSALRPPALLPPVIVPTDGVERARGDGANVGR
jgi:hypothetical protein